MPIRRTIAVPKEENLLYQFMTLVNRLRHPEELRLTQRELDILYVLYTFNPKEINRASKEKLMDKFNFSSKTQISVYLGILLNKQAIYRSTTKSGIHHFNNFFFPSGEEVPSEIVVKVG